MPSAKLIPKIAPSPVVPTYDLPLTLNEKSSILTLQNVESFSLDVADRRFLRRTLKETFVIRKYVKLSTVCRKSYLPQGNNGKYGY